MLHLKHNVIIIQLIITGITSISPSYPNHDKNLKLAYSYLYVSVDSSLYFSKIYLEESLSGGDTVEIANGYYLTGVNYMLNGNIEESVRSIIQAQEYYAKNGDFQGRANCHLILAEILYDQGKYNESLEQILTVLKIAQKKSLASVIIRAKCYTGKYYHTKGNIKKSLVAYNEALAQAEEFSDVKQLALIHANIGKHYESTGNNARALEHYLISLNSIKEINDNIITGTIYNHLGNLYQKLNEYDKSYHYHSLSLNARLKAGYKEGIGKSYKNLGELKLEMDQTDSALQYFIRSIELFNKVTYKKGIIKCENNIGQVYMKKGDYTNANNYFFKSLKHAESSGYKKGIVKAEFQIANVCFLKQEYKKCLLQLNSALRHAEESDLRNDMLDIYLLRYKSYIALNNYKKALESHIGYTKLNQYIQDIEKKQYIAELQVQYEIDKKEKENLILRNENEIASLTIKRKNTYIWFIFIVLILLSLSLILILIQFFTKRKTSIELKKLNEQLSVLNKKLDEANQEKDKFFSIIGHELRNPLWWFRNLTDMLSRNYTSMPRQKLEKALFALDDSAKTAFHLIDNLLQWSRSQLNRLHYDPSIINLYDLIEENLMLIKSVAQSKNILIDVDVKTNFKIHADKDLICTVIRNLLSNAVKFTPENGTIEISAFQKNGFCEISIKDSGIGINKEKLESLFHTEKGLTTLGLMHEKGSGLGLLLCKEFIQMHNGKIWAKSEPDKSTTFIFTIPFANKETIREKNLIDSIQKNTN